MRYARDELFPIPLAGSIATLMSSPYGSRIRLAPDFEGAGGGGGREVFEIEHEFGLDSPTTDAADKPQIEVTTDDGAAQALPDQDDPDADTGAADQGEMGDGSPDAGAGEQHEGEQRRGKKPSFQERINQLTKSRRDAEARAQQAEALAQQQAAQIAQLQRGYEQTADVAATNFEANLKTRQSEAQAEYKAAYESGDSDKMLEAQNKLIDLKAEFIRLDNWKAGRQQQAAQTQQRAQQAPSPPQAHQQRGPSERAVQWAKENPWFGQDRAMTSEAQAVDGDLKAEGYDPESPDYYDELTRRVKDTFPHRFQAQAQRQSAPASRPPATVVAPASRAAPAGKTNRRVTLTPSQVEMARKLGVPPEAYAAELLKLSGQ